MISYKISIVINLYFVSYRFPLNIIHLSHLLFVWYTLKCFRYLSFKKTILPDRKVLIGLIDLYNNGSLSWDEFSSIVKETHANRTGSPKQRVIIPDKPKEEDYFYANPQECLQQIDEVSSSS